MVVLTPRGKISRYFFGVEYSSRDVQRALMEASDEKIGSPVQRLILYCYPYNPATGKYGMAIMRIIRLSALMTVGILLIWMMRMVRVP